MQGHVVTIKHTCSAISIQHYACYNLLVINYIYYVQNFVLFVHTHTTSYNGLAV